MSKRAQNVQSIFAKNPDTKRCTDLKLLLNAHHAIEGKSYHGTLTYEGEDNSTFVEDDEPEGSSMSKARKAPTKRSDLQWHPLAGSLHGKVSVNANGAMLILYARHEEYLTDACQLADLLVSEAEQIGEALADINMEEEVAKCGK